jgi:NADPH2:quinone reductase
MQYRPDPKPGFREVLVQVHAAGVNRPDIAQRKGHYPPPSWTSPDIPGLEIAGTIVELGEDCTRWKVGDKVCSLVTGGGYAEFTAVPEGQCLPLPENFSYVEAASLPETFFTVWSNVFDRGKLGRNETLLVHGGSSGIGVAAIQLAKAWGSSVIITAGSQDKCAYCEQLGADKVINYKTEKFRDIVRELTNNKGVNVILDMVGGSYTTDNLESLSEEGRLVMINSMDGDEVNIRLSTIMRKRLIVTGSLLRPRDTTFKSSIARKLEEQVWPWLESGRVKAIIHSIFPLDKAADAHRLMETSNHIGKIVLEVMK